jgi:hypothetical protein
MCRAQFPVFYCRLYIRMHAAEIVQKNISDEFTY